ncbi:MAG: hypothetical protein O2960_24830 [Verrucomicrobia bacterium]|nr:hypothetical protein [Verrucomicrobiota bacterium]
MKIHFITIVLNGMPFISWHYPIFRQLTFDWQWTVVEGVAAPENCTSWCAQIPPGLSTDGTLECLDSIAKFDKRVVLLRSAYWHGKVAMFNAACELIQEPGLLWQVDSDEIWTVAQICKMREMFLNDSTRNSARFLCRYFLGLDIAITSRNCGNNTEYEWNRVWRIKPGVRFKSHEPPILEAFEEKPFTHQKTEAARLVFDHYAYANEAQVAFKEEYYGSENNKCGSQYKGAVDRWRKLQSNLKWPTIIGKDFMPWVSCNNVTVDKV